MVRLADEEVKNLLTKTRFLSLVFMIIYARYTITNCLEEKVHVLNYFTFLQLAIFGECDDQNLLHLIALSVDSKQYLPNTMIINRDEDSYDTYFIISGTVEVIAPVCLDNVCSRMSDAVIKRLGPGSHFGEIAAMLNIPRAADVRTITQVDCYVLSQKKLRNVTQQFPCFAAKMRELAKERLANLRHTQVSYRSGFFYAYD